LLIKLPFYGESGGQVGDTGEIIGNDFKFEVTDVQKKLGDLFVHYGKVINGSIKIKDNVELKINVEREMILEHIIQQHIYCTSH
jgi:alanyl-tRNA synthetase